MKFKIQQRNGQFGRANFRHEKHGNENVPACDLKVTCKGGKREFDMLFPLQEGKLSEVIWDEKGNLQVPYMSPLKNHRTPENVTFTVQDQPTKPKDVLEFEGTRIKVVEVSLHEKRNIDITLTIQLHDDVEKHSARLRRLMDTERSFSLEAQQEDFFNEEPEGDEEDKQGELDVKQEGEEEEEESEED